MKSAADLKKSLILGLMPDNTGKTTPMQRLAPFLRELLEHLEYAESRADLQEGRIQILMQEHILTHPYEMISSEAPTQAAPASTKSEQGSATKATA